VAPQFGHGGTDARWTTAMAPQVPQGCVEDWGIVTGTAAEGRVFPQDEQGGVA